MGVDICYIFGNIGGHEIKECYKMSELCANCLAHSLMGK